MTPDSTQMSHEMRMGHWEGVYGSKDESELSWHQDDPLLSNKLITGCSPPAGSLVDVGGGSSLLGGQLAQQGYEVTVVDISVSAIERAKARTGAAGATVNWLVGDILQQPDLGLCDVWHDRAVFHFLTHEDDRRAYVACLHKTVRPGGHVVLGAFAVDGPMQCSGLPVERHDATSVQLALGDAWSLVSTEQELHTTPWGKNQLFFWAVARLSG
ncbi:MAG: class I SAM-dependent methyltransferase [Phycisphaerales bacterium]|nr:class I SAM-dependent methyltransferase [Phycisphaerales bacterium]